MQNNHLAEKWQEKLIFFDHAFQPIVNPLSGSLFAVECLLRGHEKAGFTNIFNVFDTAYDDGELLSLDLELRKKAIAKFSEIECFKKIKLFYNFDVRITNMCNYSPGVSRNILEGFGLDPGVFCFEISERYHTEGKIDRLLNNAKSSGCQIAIDDFGSGFANFELFYFSEPDYLKLDRFLITNIDKEVKKRKFCTHITNLAHFFGISVIAEGVETEQEFLTCRDMGVDLIQGYFIQKPVTDINLIESKYEIIEELFKKNKRKVTQDSHLVNNQMIQLSPIHRTGTMEELLEKISENTENPVVPVVDNSNIPQGVISESNLKKYLYKPYGKDLLFNKSHTPSIAKFITKCPTVEITVPLEQMLEIYVANPEAEGIIITSELKYHGFMTAQSLLNTLNEKNLAYARDMNPLTKLPGNNIINSYLNKSFKDTTTSYIFVYFDFDNFKPFNDRFGFRQGDRAITLFADLLKEHMNDERAFIGHIGGDDFFCGAGCSSDTDDSCLNILGNIRKIIKIFTDTASSFYDFKEQESGKYVAKDRAGTTKSFPLLTVSAAIIRIPEGERNTTAEELSNILAMMKKEAKMSTTKTSYLDIGAEGIVSTNENLKYLTSTI
ncbi:diguanylate cyclase/phosphodiesterase [Denitrovibrio acetiphilus DSM 12809]|uniref:Diguanylate cyclase/phosphodiesterase n=1 Tax=Denitrovibrio acetiphilus (strain DSM 12809 / NBRC 114555 / N2460) TaxID=522772 RepID=D4H1N3_DENA2|nr:GGDEF domain-containing protein [Denitrovibrio acetiphilus]ADD68793.1 diguanylate cyclase/phosphodiesterase [Denitrovibrio acetiphilus DSM 12809]